MTAVPTALSHILSSRFGVPEEEITADATLRDLDLDSLAIAELTLVVRDDLGVPCTDDEMRPQDTLGQLVQLLRSRGLPA
ncbi:MULTISPECIES: acyl carrier protein [unclassified Streptomyces]|uniref:acyl carrier protein n=1 Tax=unclassified Streptomyces TaxID=2593676 RepID=UPI0033AAD579